MRFTKCLVVVGVLTSFAVLQAGGDQKGEKELLGTWSMVSGIKAGQNAPKEVLEHFRLTFSPNGKLSVKAEDKKEMEGTYKLIAGKKPAEIDLTVNNKTIPGIYVFEGGNLKLCFGEPNSRPTEFASPEGSKTMLLVLKRDKK